MIVGRRPIRIISSTCSWSPTLSVKRAENSRTKSPPSAAGISMQAAANVNVGPPATAGTAPLNRTLLTMSNSKFLRDSMLSLSIPTRDADYYISDGNTVLLVENILFKVRPRVPPFVCEKKNRRVLIWDWEIRFIGLR